MPVTRRRALPALGAVALLAGGCSSTYYDAMEKVGYHKRDILVSRVEAARDSQSDAQAQFESALEQFASVVEIERTELAAAYEHLDAEFEASEAAAEDVSERIDKVESVAVALFEEWRAELDLYQNQDLRATSAARLGETEQRYRGLLAAMRRAEASMMPVLDSFRDNVLFLKHNLNAQAIGALRGELRVLESEVALLNERMTRSIEASDAFIRSLESG